MADPLCSAVSGLFGDSVILAVSISCVRGVHVAGLFRTPGGAGLTSPSAEAAGGVKKRPTGPSAASCAAVLLTPTGVRSYARDAWPWKATREAGREYRGRPVTPRDDDDEGMDTAGEIRRKEAEERARREREERERIEAERRRREEEERRRQRRDG